MSGAERFVAFTAAWSVTTLVGAWLIVGLFGSAPNLRDIGEPCRDHGGVRQWVPSPNFNVPSADGIVVCMDGKVGEVPR